MMMLKNETPAAIPAVNEEAVRSAFNEALNDAMSLHDGLNTRVGDINKMLRTALAERATADHRVALLRVRLQTLVDAQVALDSGEKVLRELIDSIDEQLPPPAPPTPARESTPRAMRMPCD